MAGKARPGRTVRARLRLQPPDTTPDHLEACAVAPVKREGICATIPEPLRPFPARGPAPYRQVPGRQRRTFRLTDQLSSRPPRKANDVRPWDTEERFPSLWPALLCLGATRVEFISETVLDAAGQWWIYPLLLVLFFVDGFAMVVPSETLIVALTAFSRQSGEPNLWILGVTALLGAIAGDNMAYTLGRRIGPERWGWMRKPKVQKVFGWARSELEKRGAVMIFTGRYIPWGRVAVNYVAGTTAFPRRRFFSLDAIAGMTWVAYSIGIGLLASSLPWLQRNPLLSAGIAVVFAILLGILIDHLLRWWHKRLGRLDAKADAERAPSTDSAAAPSSSPDTTPVESVRG